MSLTVNGRRHDLPEPWRSETLLNVLRELLGLVGTKFGCGVGSCGACSVLVDGRVQRSCLLQAGDLAERGAPIETIESLAGDDDTLHPLQQAWLDEAVPQCGYCQAGQLISAAALLRETPRPSAAQVDAALAGNLCRCGTYPRIRRAVLRAAGSTS